MHRTRRFFAIFAAVVGLWAPLAHAAQYTYDLRGRLTSVTESDGSTISYSYDANGNILSITRTSATLPLTISTFSPSTGPVGTSVTIRGTGFNPVAGQNAVSFGVLPATVTSSNATTIVATVPVLDRFRSASPETLRHPPRRSL
jgi:YD repeat-containing protein